MFALIAVDIDGTLLRSDQTLSPRTRDALRTARDQLAILMLASGRPEHGLRHLAERLGLGLDRLVLSACNGAAVVDAETEEIICHRTLEHALVARVLDLVEELGLAAMTPLGHVVHATREDGYNVADEAPANGMELAITPRFEELDEPLHKILVCAEPDLLAQHLDTFRGELDGHAELALSAPFYLEITPPWVDKGSGLLDYCAARDLDPAEAIAFGDNENDLPMLRVAGTGVAMGNALDHVKAGADRVTASNDEDGIAEALDL